RSLLPGRKLAQCRRWGCRCHLPKPGGRGAWELSSRSDDEESTPSRIFGEEEGFRSSEEDTMKHNKALIATIAVIVLGIGWYAFRPELLFVNKTVNEGFPGAQAASMKSGT